MGKQIAGVIPVVHTPFDDEDRINETDMKREIDWAFDQGADGICTGMVSEILRLTGDERIQLTSRIGGRSRRRDRQRRRRKYNAGNRVCSRG